MSSAAASPITMWKALIAANPDALVYGDTYGGTASLARRPGPASGAAETLCRAAHHLCLALWLRRAGKRRGSRRSLQDALLKVQPMKLNLSLLVLIVAGLCRVAAGGAGVAAAGRRCCRRMTPWPGLIIQDVRLPRTVLALIVGARLGLSGAVLQGFTRNPLAEPALLGVSSGAALGAVIAIYFGLAALSPVTGPLMGMVGALAACALTFALGRNGTVALVLAGAAVSSLTAAGIALALNFAPNPYAAYEIMTWLLGSLADKSWTQVVLVLPFAMRSAACCWR